MYGIYIIFTYFYHKNQLNAGKYPADPMGIVEFRILQEGS